MFHVDWFPQNPWLFFFSASNSSWYIIYQFIYLFDFQFHADLASSWANNVLWSIEWNCLIMVCGVFCKYIVLSEMWRFHNNSTIRIHLFSRSLTTPLGFHDVLSGLFYCQKSGLHSNFCGGWKGRTRIAFFFRQNLSEFTFFCFLLVILYFDCKCHSA